MGESPFKTNFLKKRNLEAIVALGAREVRTYQNLIEENVNDSMEIVTKKKNMERILQEIKPLFYELTRLDPVKDPKIIVKKKNRLALLAQMIYTDGLSMSLISALSIMVGSSFAIWGSSVFESILAGVSAFSGIFAARYGVDFFTSYKKLERIWAFNTLLGKLFIPKSMKEDTVSVLAHEYVHHVLLEYDTEPEDKFVGEGIATAVSMKMLQNLGEKEPCYRLKAADYMLTSLLATAYLISEQEGVPMPIIPGSFKPKVRAALEAFDYAGGLSMVLLAEEKHGEKKLYPELFKGNYELLMI